MFIMRPNGSEFDLSQGLNAALMLGGLLSLAALAAATVWLGLRLLDEER